MSESSVKKQLDMGLLDKHLSPWLEALSLADISNYSLEEVYELIAAIEAQDDAAICEELGDLYLHLMLYVRRAEQEGRFTADQIQAVLERKLTQRTLQDETASPEEAHRYWIAKKRADKTNQNDGLLNDIPVTMPALLRSYKIQDRAGEVNFDWDNVHDIMEKLKEETHELEVEIKKGDKQAMLLELGDILFTCVNIARHLHLNPEQALRAANNKFVRRFHQVEKLCAERNLEMQKMDFASLLAIWDEVKQLQNDVS